jgi:hypothetical protein
MSNIPKMLRAEARIADDDWTGIYGISPNLAFAAASRIEKLEAALSLAQDWIENRAIHAGDLCTSNQCVCGKALVLFNARKALEGKDG